ncbi:Pyocin activator protein PrtN [Paracoccus pantotrophus]|nr:Pyocin activator protein PrtN [Paracoccus pantotrophus]
MGKQGINTIWLLMAQYEGRAMIGADVVCRDFFAPLTLPVFLRKVSTGEIPLPLVRMENSQKGAKMVHLSDLAAYIDARAESARKETRALGR